ncbi:hypothetical protein EUGRSUZ_E02507 [Eucalyptus grandis]|uniref:Uncharacterized protein n=2 Tax=Eucalyptus grandis TaxID=71139 RepID=A0ACC3KW43_EUCGR|nr:hypothetical protein EUGRSUZ_E02507 [Eucalyptus grandis]
MKDDDVHVLAEPGAKRAVPKGLKLPADLRFPGPSPPASPRLLQDAAAGPQVKKALLDRTPSIVVNGEGEEDAALAESVRSADREIVANDFEDDDSDGVVIDVENQNADRTEASDSTAMETNLVFFL